MSSQSTVPPMFREWFLDDVFAQPATARQHFLSHPRLTTAFAAAATAFREQQEMLHNNPGICGAPTAPRAAAAAFLADLQRELAD